MNVTGRQMARSSSSVHHQRQYSDNFSDAPDNNKWLQSSLLNSSQGFGFFDGGGVQGSRMSRNGQLSQSVAAPDFLGSSSLRKNGDKQVLPSELSPGLLDLHSFDTELLSEMPIPSQSNGPPLHHHARRRSFDNFEPYLSTNKQTNKSSGLPENNLRVNNVAKIKVVVRKRPLNKKEKTKEEDVITIESNSNSLTVHETKFKVDLTEYVEKHEFVFDAVLNEDVSNAEVYSESVEPVVPLIFHRTKATCFAYGQTGSGKTYTMKPLPLKASEDILRLMHHTYRTQGFQLFFSFFEIYGGKLFDLLNDRKKLCMREDGKQQVCIVGLQEYRVSDVGTIREFIEKGNATRSTGTTGANEESSRSHAILQLAIKRSADGSESKPARLVGKLSFIDLAGSERGADTTDNDKQTRIEGAEINKSLLALKECIRALDNDQGHIPFRGSKLTEVLRDSFVGNSRTVMISCISPGSGSCEHTLNTLRYADRVKSLSKGNSSKRDPVSSTLNLKESTVLPLSSGLQTGPSSKDSVYGVPKEKNRFGWSKLAEREVSPPFTVDRVPSGRADGNSSSSLYSDYYKGGLQNNLANDDFDQAMEIEEEHMPSRVNKKAENHQSSALESKKRTGIQLKQRVIANEEFDSYYEDDLNALLREEEDLVTAHRQQVEETMNVVRKEMDLLVEADQPGNQLDDYISKLSAILSQKAAGIMQLQTQLAQFQKRLSENNVLVSSRN